MEDKFFLYFGLAVISIPTYLLIAKVLFGSLQKFKDCVFYCFNSDWESPYTAGRSWAKFKFSYFLGLCAMAVYGEGVVLVKYLPGVAEAIHGCAKGIILFRV